MPKKSIKGAAFENASVFDTIIRGPMPAQDVQDVQNAQDMQNTQDAKDIQDAKNAKAVKSDKIPMERLNLKIPTEIKEYLTVAAAKASIEQKRNISLTEYLCNLVRADMERCKDH